MAWTQKLTVQRGKVRLKDVALSAGTAEAQSDTMSLNLDITKLTRGEALIMLDNLKAKIFNMKWPAA